MKQGLSSNERFQERQRNRERRAGSQFEADLRSVLGTPAGKRVLWGIVFDPARCGLWEEPPAGNDGLMMTARQNLGRRLLKDCARIDPSAFRAMATEGVFEMAEDHIQTAAAAVDAEREEQNQ